jgi:hypothetical protein
MTESEKARCWDIMKVAMAYVSIDKDISEGGRKMGIEFLAIMKCYEKDITKELTK